jgi:hypothetical protein
VRSRPSPSSFAECGVRATLCACGDAALATIC